VVAAEPNRYLRIPMHQGLLESQESSKVPIGFMTELVNWVPEQTGGLRARGKWLKGSVAGLPSTRQNRGIGTFNRFTDPVIVQQSSVYTTGTTVSGSANTTPSVTWTVPTTPGNTLIACIGLQALTGFVTFTVTATGWTNRGVTSPVTATNATPYTLVYEQVTTTSYSGSVTPFTIANSNAAINRHYSLVILEVAGLASFDVTAHNSGTNTLTQNSPLTVTTTTATTTQASEFALAFTNVSHSTPAQDPPTSTITRTGWTEQQNPGYYGQALLGTIRSKFLVDSKTVRATGTQSITAGMVFSDVSNDQERMDTQVLTWKGWNSTAVPSDSGHALLAANYNGSTVDIWAIDRDTLDTGTWRIVDAALPSSGEPVAFVMGMGAAYYTSASFTGIRRYDGVTGALVATSPIGARCLAINHDRMWAGGPLAYPARLNYTNLLDPFAWTGTGSGFWDIGTDDGEFVEDITPFNGGLAIGKENSLWFLSGSITTDFARVQLSSGGAAPGRSLLTTPFGAVIAGTDMVWLYDGDTVTRLGNAIEVSYGIAGYCTSSYIDGSIYIADPTAGRVYVFNLGGPVGTWRVEECADTIGTLYNVGGRQFMGPYSTTLGSLVNFRDFPAPARGKDYDPLPMSYRMRTGDLWVDGALRTATPRQLYLQLRQRGGNPADPGLVVTPVFDGVDANDCDVGADNPGTRRVKVQGFPQKQRVGSFGFGITQTLASGDASVFDIEDAWVEYIRESTL
jgi:hypothetical protein